MRNGERYPGFCQGLISLRLKGYASGSRRALRTARTNRYAARAALALSVVISAILNVAHNAFNRLRRVALAFGLILLLFHLLLQPR